MEIKGKIQLRYSKMLQSLFYLIEQRTLSKLVTFKLIIFFENCLHFFHIWILIVFQFFVGDLFCTIIGRGQMAGLIWCLVKT